jgi:hypothetical protein
MNRSSELIDIGPAADVVHQTGTGPVSAATVLVAWSHPGRVRGEAAFAAPATGSTAAATGASTVP